MPELSSSPPVALYVHIPFCRARCAYCDFNTYAGLESLIARYAAAVCQEIELAGARWEHPAAATVYFGGGTPSLLPLDLLARLLQALRAAFSVAGDAEITLEANPGTVAPPYLDGLQDLGVNRLSLGAQSAHDDELRLLGRIHAWSQAVEAVAWARQAGFANLNLDLISGLPAQTPARWQATLDAALALEPQHLSLYSLSVEEGTPLASSIQRGALPPPDQDLAAEMVELAEGHLAREGFFHYEISNWARRGRASPNPEAQDGWPAEERASEEISPYVCRHNLAYWRNEPWLGLGAGAHSWMDGQRWANARHPQAYVAALEEGGAPVEETACIDRRTEMGETMMMGLRLAEGVSDARFRARFGVGLAEPFEQELDELRALGLLDWDGRAACLTARGRLLGNQVFQRFV